MTRFVVDASIFIAGLVEEVDTGRARTVLLDARIEGAIAPAHLALEVLNALLMKQRRGVIDADYRAAAVERFIAFPQDRDLSRDRDAVLRRIIGLAERHGLTVYDAAYLELAQRGDLTLGTLDGALRRAAQAEGVAVAPA